VDVEEGPPGRTLLERSDGAGLLDDEAAPRAVAGVRDEDRVAEARRDRLERDVDAGRIEALSRRRRRVETEDEDETGDQGCQATGQRQLSGSMTKNQSCDQRSRNASQRSSAAPGSYGAASTGRASKVMSGQASTGTALATGDATRRGLPWSIRAEATYPADIGPSLRRETGVGNPDPRAMLPP
jgi:hypothetical protein